MTRDWFMNHLKQTFAEAMGIVEKKNQDYGADSNPFKNFELVSHLGIPVEIGILTRFADKVARISNLIGGKQPAVVDETLDDTILDAINYLAILRAWLQRGAEPESTAGHVPKADALIQGYVKHYKGGVYGILGTANDSEKPFVPMVIYLSLITGEVWVRPSEEFWGDTAENGVRFQPISRDEAYSLVQACRDQNDPGTKEIKPPPEALVSAQAYSNWIHGEMEKALDLKGRPAQ
jgi:hypothetical protein